MAEKNPEEGRAGAWGLGWRDSNHHPEAVVLSWVGPVRGDSKGEMFWISLTPGAIFSQASLCGGQMGRQFEK
ncbi:MAG: hypothetical protein AMJ94_12580 [Deltaproteobacteria bacterium SM23_61]|nr:MAG: hypothetical protein AMJ94_12580 [Deltaproteobacteria bacterium SM23_61]